MRVLLGEEAEDDPVHQPMVLLQEPPDCLERHYTGRLLGEAHHSS